MDLHRDLAATVVADPELRAAWYRLEDAARTCRRAAEEFGCHDGFRPAG